MLFKWFQVEETLRFQVRKLVIRLLLLPFEHRSFPLCELLLVNDDLRHLYSLVPHPCPLAWDGPILGRLLLAELERQILPGLLLFLFH